MSSFGLAVGSPHPFDLAAVVTAVAVVTAAATTVVAATVAATTVVAATVAADALLLLLL